MTNLENRRNMCFHRYIFCSWPEPLLKTLNSHPLPRSQINRQICADVTWLTSLHNLEETKQLGQLSRWHDDRYLDIVDVDSFMAFWEDPKLTSPYIPLFYWNLPCFFNPQKWHCDQTDSDGNGCSLHGSSGTLLKNHLLAVSANSNGFVNSLCDVLVFRNKMAWICKLHCITIYHWSIYPMFHWAQHLYIWSPCRARNQSQKAQTSVALKHLQAVSAVSGHYWIRCPIDRQWGNKSSTTDVCKHIAINTLTIHVNPHTIHW